MVKAFSNPELANSARNVTQVTFKGQSSINPLIEADGSGLEAGSGEKASPVVRVQGTRELDEADTLWQSTQKVSSFKREVALTVVASSSSSVASSQFSRTILTPSLQQGVVTNIAAVKTSTLLTHFIQKKSNVEPSATEKNITQVSATEGKQAATRKISQQDIPAESSVLHQGAAGSSSDVSRNQSSAISKSTETNKLLSSGVSRKQYLTTLPLQDLQIQKQISNDVIAASSTLSITKSLQTLMPEETSSSNASLYKQKTIPESTDSFKTSSEPSQQQMISLEGLLSIYSRKTTTLSLSHSRPANTSSTEFHSGLVSFRSTATKNSIALLAATHSQASETLQGVGKMTPSRVYNANNEIKKSEARVLLGTPFLPHSVNTDNIRNSIKATPSVLEPQSSGRFVTRSLTIASTSVLESLEDTLGKLQGKEKVVRTLASGIVTSPVFHHAIRHIGDLLKNETGLVHSVSRIESMLGHLQNLLARETRNHVRNSVNFSLPLVDTVQKGNSSNEISKQVDSKLDGISTKLKRISSVLTELQIKKREKNSTIVEKSLIERPGNFTTVDEKHNRLIELLLKRFSKLEALIQRNRDFVNFNTSKTQSIESVNGTSGTSGRVVQHSSSKGSSSIIKSKQEASAMVSSSNEATLRISSPITSRRDQIFTNTLLSSKEVDMHHTSTTMKSTISISSTRYMNDRNVSQTTTNRLNLDLLQVPKISSSSVHLFTSLVGRPPPRNLMTSHDSVTLLTDVTSIRKAASSLVRAKPSIGNAENHINVSSTVLRPSVSTTSSRTASAVVGVPQSVSNHHTYNKTHHGERSEEFTFVTFRSGMEAGVFTDRGKVKNMESCVERCYNHPSCHVAFMVGNNCYSIHCYSQKTCEILPVQSPIISTRVVYLKDRMLRLPYNTTTQPKASSLVTDDRNFTIKNCAKNVTVLKNMTFLAGMSAGNYTDYGTVDSIQACSNICCSKKICDAAFMILNNCFTIDCISDKACHAIPSRSHKVNTSIVYFRKTLSSVRFQQVRVGVPEAKSQPLCPLLSGVLKGVTFDGGIITGNFTDHGFVQEFSSCIEKCCSSKTCDVAFMVEKNCYSVKCAANKRRCLPVVARSKKFKTFMAVKKTGDFPKFSIPAGSNSTCAQSGPTQNNFTFRRGIKAGNFTGRGQVKNMDSCIQKCCSSPSCSAAFMIGKHCYSVVCSSAKDCETVLAKKTNLITSIAFVNRERGKDKAEEIESNQRTTFTRSILGGHCDVTDVQHNVNITGGWRAGKFLRISDIKDMKKCTEACCDYHGCGAAMFIDKYCYNLICFKQRGCQLIGSKEAFMIDKFVAVRKNVGHVLSPFKKAQIATLTAFKEHMNHSSFKQEVRNANKIRNRSTIFNLETPEKTRNGDDLHKLSRSVMQSLSIQPTRTRFLTKSEGLDKTVFNSNAKKHEIPFYISSKVKDRSLIPSLLRTPHSHIKSSAASLHDSPSIAVRHTSSISVTKQLTNVQDKTQSVGTLKISNSKTLSPLITDTPAMFNPSSSTSKEYKLPRQSLSLDTPFTTSSNFTEEVSVSSASSAISEDGINVTAVPQEGYSFKSDYSLLKGKANHKTKRTYACTHTFVFNNATLRGGLKAGDVKNEGKVEGMEECVEMCCKTPECNVALLLKENCYIVACFNKENCEAVPSKQTKGRTKVAYVARSKDETELIKQLISHTETSKTNVSSANRTKDGKPTGNKDFQPADVAIRQGSCFRSPILRDVRFKLGRHAGDFKSVGLVRNVDRCVALCCKERACNAIFMLGSRCHLVSCSNEQDCQTVEAKSKFYKPTVVYLARSKVEVAYFFKLIPKEALGKYQDNATLAVNASTDEDESAIRRSQLERPEWNTSVGVSYSQRSNANVTAASEPSNAFTTLENVTPSLSSMSVPVIPQSTPQSSNIVSPPETMAVVLSSTNVTAPVAAIPRLDSSIAATTMKIVPPLASVEVTTNLKPTLESSNAFALPQELSRSFSILNVTHTLTSSTTLTTPKVFSSPQEHRLSLYQHGVATSNSNTKSVTTSLLNTSRSPVLPSNVTNMPLKPLTITTIERRGNESSEPKTHTRSGLSAKHYLSQENAIEEKPTMANTTATPTPGVKSSIQAQLKMVVTDITKSTDTVSQLRESITRLNISRIKSPVAQFEASKIRSSARLTPKISSVQETLERSRSDETIATAHFAKKEDVDIMITKVDKMTSTNPRASSVFGSNYDYSTANFAASHPTPAPARTEVETFPASLARHRSTVSLQSGLRTLTAAHQQNGNINESWRHISQADSTTMVDTSDVPSGKLQTNSSVSIIVHSNKSSDVTSIENKTSGIEPTRRHFVNEHKRGDIAMLRNSAFQKSPGILSHLLIPSSFVSQINATPGTGKQQVMTVNQPKLANLKSVFQSSILSISNNSENTSMAQTLLPGASDSKGMVTTRSTLNGPHYIQPSPTTRGRRSSSTSELLLRESPSIGLRAQRISTSAVPLLTSSEVLFSSIPIQRSFTHMISPSRGAEVYPTPTSHTLEITRTKSAYAPSSARRINATTISSSLALALGRMKTPLPASSIQSVLPKTSRLSSTLSTLLYLSDVVTAVKPTTTGSKLLKGTNAVDDPRLILTAPHIPYTLHSPPVSRIKKISYTSEGLIATKVVLSSSAETKSPLSTSNNSLLSSTTRTIPLPTSSFKLSSEVASKSMVRSRGNFRTSSSVQPYLSTTTNASAKLSISSASLPRNVSFPPHSHINDSAANNSSRGEFVSKETDYLSHTASQLLHHSKLIKTSLKVEKSVTMPPGNQNQTSSSLLKAKDLLQSLQGFISNMASKRQAILRNGKTQDSEKQNISHDSYQAHQIDEILKTLSSDFPNIPQIKALNQSVLMLVSNTSRNGSDFMSVKSLLNNIRNILSHRETLLHSTPRLPARTTTQSMSTSSVPVEKRLNFSSVNIKDMPGRTKSIVHGPSSQISSKVTVNYRNVSLAFPPSISKADNASSQLLQVAFPSEAKTQHSSSVELQKRVEIPFAGRLLEQIKVLQYSSMLKQRHTPTDSTPIAGGLLEQIRPLHKSPQQPLHTISANLSQMSSERAPLITKPLASRSYTREADKENQDKATSVENLQPTVELSSIISSNSKGVLLSTSVTERSAKYASSRERDIHSKSPKHATGVSYSKASFTSQTASPSPKRDLEKRTSHVRRTGPVTVITAIPSVIIKPLEIVHSKISTPVLTNTPAPKRLESLTLLQGSRALPKETSQTVKTTLDHSTTIRFPSTKSDSTEKTSYKEKNSMFGYFAKLLKSIKDILTKKNSRPGRESNATSVWNGPTPSYQHVTKATSVSSGLRSALAALFITPQQSVVTSIASSVTPTKPSSLQLLTSRALDISLAMQPLHQVALNVTGIRQAALCEHSPSHENATMRGGIDSGIFKEVEMVNNDAECISQCCFSKTCDAAFLLSNRCFLVTCRSKTLCQSVPAKNVKFRPRVIYIEKRMALAKEERNQESLKLSLSPSPRFEASLTSFQFSRSVKSSISLNTPRIKSHGGKAVCQSSDIQQNVTLRGGIKSGHFKDQGTVESMQKCIDLCCSERNCSVAFMLLSRCFSVSCYNETSCNSIPARSLIFQPQLAYLRRNDTSRSTLNNHFATVAISKTKTSVMVFSSSSELGGTESKKSLARFHDNCRYSNSEIHVTLRGGLNAGSFLDSGVVDNITECVDNCCQATKCDVAFMIVKRCFLVTCYSSSLCQSIPARNSGYFTEIVHIARDENAVVRDLLARLVQPSSPPVKMKSVVSSSVETSTFRVNLLNSSSSLFLNSTTGGSISKLLTLSGHFTGFYSGSSLPSRPPAVPAFRAVIKSAIAPLNVNKQGIVALIQTIGMSTRPLSTRHVLDQNITPSSVKLNSPSSSQWPETVGDGNIQGKQLETVEFSKDETCQSTAVFYNATMRGGINAGVFKDQGTVQNMRKCIEQCCRWQFCSVAFMLLTRCYIIACYNDHLCDPVTARNVTFTPRIAFISRVRRDHGNFSRILENIPTPTLSVYQKSHLKTSTGGTNFTTAKVYSNKALFPSTLTNAAPQLPSSLAIKPSPSQSSFSKVFSSRPVLRHNCTNSEQKHNVTLRGGLSAGHFKDRGKVADMEKCVDFCCKEDHCDVALMLLENCFTVICHNKRLCESVPAKTGRYKSRIVYVGKNRSDKSTQLVTHKLTKTISLLDAALPAMGENNETETWQNRKKTTVSERTRSFESQQLTQLLFSPPFEEVDQTSNISKIENLTSTEHSTNQSETNKEHESLILQKKLHKNAKTKTFYATASQRKQHHLISASVSSGHNTSLLFSSTIKLNASVWALPEPGKSAIKRGGKSGHKSGLTSTFTNPSQHSFPQPSSCLSSPISYNVTLRNGIRSGYFRDQGRVENNGACIQKCCGAEDCDVAFLLKQRCYLVTCYTKKGCETVPARHSLFRPRVSHVQRTNVSQLMSFMDEQDDAYSSGKTASIQSRSSTRTHFITPSSTLPAPVNSLDSSSIHKTETKASPTHKAQASPAHHSGTKHHKLKTGKNKHRSGNLETQKRSQHVTVAPELKKRKSMKSTKSRRARHKPKPKETKSESSRAKMQHFQLQMVEKKDQKLSHSDLNQLFHLMKPTKRVNNAHSMSDVGPQETNSDSLKKTTQPDKISLKDGAIASSFNFPTVITTAPTPSASKQDSSRKAVAAGFDHRTSKKKNEATSLHRKSSASTHKGATKQRTRPLAAIKPHSRSHKSQTTVTGRLDFATQVKALLEKEGDNKEHFEQTKKAKFSRKTTTKQKATFMNTKEFHDYTTTSTTSRLTAPTRTRLRLNTPRQPTVLPPKVSSHRGSKFRETKSTVPSLPTQVPDLRVSSCATGHVEYNQTLRGGLSSGLFHEVGKVTDIRGCSQHCCSSPICDLAFMVLNHCFLVTCSSSNPHMCDSTPALATNFNPMISRVSRSGSKDNKDQPMKTASDRNNKPTPTVKPLATPPKLPRQPEMEAPVPASNVTNQSTAENQANSSTSPANSSRRHPEAKESSAMPVSASEMLPSPPGCISSLTEHNVTLRGGLHAGKFTDAGKVDGSYTCTELCCKADNCDVAFFAFHRCFLVNCFDEYLCTSTPSLLPNFNPTLVHVYRHHSKPTPKPSTTLPPINYVLQQIEDETKTKSNSKNKTCAHSEVYEEVTLRKGYKAGKFTSHGKINFTDQCVDFCCRQSGCDLIFMFLNNCFTVSCSSGVACEIVSARQSRFKPRVVYLIKNNSTKLIKPSELNSSLSDPKSFVGKQPVNAVHYKELLSDKNNGGWYKKDFSQMSNDTETIDEEFTEVPDNKITSRTVINTAGKVNSQHLKHNVSERIVGKEPLDTLQNKVLRLSERNQESYKKNFTQMNNDTETVDEEFTKVPGNKLTSRTVINSAVNASSQRQKHNISNNLIAKSDIKTTKQRFKDNHQPKLESGEMTNHKESRTDEKMDLVLNKLTNVTEENKRLEGELHVVMAKQNKRRHKSRVTSSVPARGERMKEKSQSSKSIENKRIKYKERRRMGRLGFSGDGSGMDSSARKRVVIVDTDRPPVFPPTDEHNIEEHSIHAFRRKTYQKDHHLRKSGKVTPEQRPLKNQRNNTKTGLKHWDPTNEHDIEEHSIYSISDVSESRSESMKNPHVKVGEGSEVKYGQPEEDTDDLELNDILKLKPNNKHARRPGEPVWISSSDENKDDRESFHEQIPPTQKWHFKFNDRTNKEHTNEDEFHIEHQDKSIARLADKNVWMNTRNEDIDHKESFHEEIFPTHKAHFQLDSQKGLGHTSEDEFHVKHQYNSKLADKHVWINTRNEDIDNMESFHDQIAPTHKSHFQLDGQRGLEHASEEEFHIHDPTSPAKHMWMSSTNKNKDRLENFDEQIAPTHRSHFQLDKQKERMREDEFDIDGNDKSEDSESHVWVSSRDRNEDHLGSFHDQIAPTHKSNFQFENQRINKNSREDKRHKEQQDKPDVSQQHVWKSTRNRNEDRLKSFDDQIASTHKSTFQLDKQRENQNTKEDDFDIETHYRPEEPQRHTSIGSRNKNEDQPGSFNEQVAPTHISHFQLDKSGDNYHSNDYDFHLEDNVEPQDSEKHVGESSRNRSKDHMEMVNVPEPTVPSHTSRFQFDNQGKTKHINRDEFHIKQQHKPSVHEVAGAEPKDQHDNERPEMLSQNVSKEPETDFTMSNSSEPALSEFVESEKNTGTSQVGHGAEGPVFVKEDFAKGHKRVPHDHNEGSNSKPIEEMALTEKPLDISTSSSVTEHTGNGHKTLTLPDRKQENNSHEKPDLDAIYHKINNIYNRLQDLFDAQSRRERNTTRSSRKTRGRLDGVSENSKRREEGIPTPPVSSLRPTTLPSRLTPPTKRVRVVKQFVTDDFGGSGVPPHRHRDALMDYIKTIYNRVQELYKRKLKTPPPSKRRKFHHVFASRDDRKQRKTSKGRSHTRKAKNYHRKKVEEEAVLKEMKRIYKNMKEMYHQQRKAQKKAKIIAQTSEGQHQRSYIPSRYGARESDGRTAPTVESAKPTGLVETLERPISLTSSIVGARVKPQVHKTGKYPSCIV